MILSVIHGAGDTRTQSWKPDVDLTLVGIAADTSGALVIVSADPLLDAATVGLGGNNLQFKEPYIVLKCQGQFIPIPSTPVQAGNLVSISADTPCLIQLCFEPAEQDHVVSD